jgi:DNA-binding NarL/FixJ family response regulator
VSCTPSIATAADGSGGDGTMGNRDQRPDPVPVVVQHRQRLFRLGITGLLDAADGVRVVTSVTTEDELVAACASLRPAVAVIEAQAVSWDGRRLGAVLRRVQPLLTIIGLAGRAHLAGDGRSGPCDPHLAALVPHDAGIAGVLDAIRRPAALTGARRRVSANGWRASAAPAVLTGRELEILTLVGGGLTAGEVSRQLGISHKTVENHKQRVFAKLGVQNQAHAVAVAIRGGMMPAELVIRSTRHDPALG